MESVEFTIVIFFQLLEALYRDYFPLVREATLDGSGGPVSRLEEFLNKAVQDGGVIKKPAKELAPGFI